MITRTTIIVKHNARLKLGLFTIISTFLRSLVIRFEYVMCSERQYQQNIFLNFTLYQFFFSLKSSSSHLKACLLKRQPQHSLRYFSVRFMLSIGEDVKATADKNHYHIYTFMHTLLVLGLTLLVVIQQQCKMWMNRKKRVFKRDLKTFHGARMKIIFHSCAKKKNRKAKESWRLNVCLVDMKRFASFSDLM